MPDDVYGEPPSPEAIAALVAVLGLAIDRYVKNRARRTIVENAKADPAKPKCRWVVESDACDFCKQRGSFLVNPGDAVADSHRGCKCHLDVLHNRSDKLLEMEQNEPLVKNADDSAVFGVSPVVNTKAYHDAFGNAPLPKPVRESAYVQAGRILEATAGTELEHMVAIDARTGKLVADNLGRKAFRKKTGFSKEEMAAIRAHNGKVVILHNHPASYPPSYKDMMTLSSDDQIAGSFVLGFDGSVWFMAIDDRSIAKALEGNYNTLKGSYGDFAERKAVLKVLEDNSRHRLFDWRRLR